MTTIWMFYDVFHRLKSWHIWNRSQCCVAHRCTKMRLPHAIMPSTMVWKTYFFFKYVSHIFSTKHFTLPLLEDWTRAPARLLDRAFQSQNNIPQPALVASLRRALKDPWGPDACPKLGQGLLKHSKTKGFWGIDFLANTLYWTIIESWLSQWKYYLRRVGYITPCRVNNQ